MLSAPLRLALLTVFWAAPGCIATRSDISRLDARFLVLDNRLKGVEGTAEKLEENVSEQAADTRKSLFARMNEAQDLIRQIRTELLALDGDVQMLKGWQQTEQMQLSSPRMGTAITLYGRILALEDVSARLQSSLASYRNEVTGIIARSETDQELYDQAMSEYKSGNYPRARDMFEQLLIRYPASKLTANVHFWIGEVYFQREEWINAIDKYKIVMDQYSSANKAPAAYYKAALALQKLGEKQLAADLARELISKYPKSDQAKSARTLADK